MRTLVVSAYPPARDGLAAYALQLVSKLRASGETVDVVSPTASGARYHANFLSLRGRLKLARLARNYDRVVVQYHPFFFLGSHGRLGYLGDVLSLGLLFGAGKAVEVYVHEVDYGAGSRRMMAPLWRLVWRRPTAIITHTAKEQVDMVQAFRLPPRRVQLVLHGHAFVARAQMSRAQARHELGIGEAAFVFLCIGFIQEHKGFDRAVRAFAALGPNERLELHVVGSVRVPTPEHSAYLHQLRLTVRETPCAHLHDAFVSDARFDRWILAANVVVLPYRQIWSSGVVERAALLERPAILTDVGGLRHQAREDTVLVSDEAGLMTAMARSAGVEVAPWAADRALPATYLDAVQWVDDRARRLRLWDDGMAGVSAGTNPAMHRRVIEPLPFPVSPNAIGAKRMLLQAATRLTRWQLMPVVSYINRLRDEVVLQEFTRSERDHDLPG